MALTPGGFTALDWTVLAAYLLVVVAIGAAAARRSGGREELFLAGRSMPVWAVAASVLATSLSAATFIGGPQQAYTADLSYFSANLGALLAAVIVAVVFVPAYYRLGVVSVYELLGRAFGPPARVAASASFMLGRIMASGARLFMVAIPFALIAFGDTTPSSLVISIAAITVVATAYTALGGIRAVIWTDVLQAVIIVATVAVALGLIWSRIPAGAAEILAALRDAGGGGPDKLRVIDLSLDPGRPYTLWTALVGFTLFNLAAFGTDQDLVQRMLTCRSARGGGWSVILANLGSWPVLLLFLAMGLLLHVFYQRPELMGDAAPGYAVADSRGVFLAFILGEMPAGVRGLMMAGLFAAAMSSLDSALNAMASATIADFYRPWCRRRGLAPGRAERTLSRWITVFWALLLGGFACACVWWQAASDRTLITFALGVMVFAYGGLVGVFAAALFTSRGNARTALAALATGFVLVLLMQDFCWWWWAPGLGLTQRPAFPWIMTLAAAASFAVCCTGRRHRAIKRGARGGAGNGRQEKASG